MKQRSDPSEPGSAKGTESARRREKFAESARMGPRHRFSGTLTLAGTRACARISPDSPENAEHRRVLGGEGGFEPSKPFISRTLPRSHAHFHFFHRETLAGKSEVEIFSGSLRRCLREAARSPAFRCATVCESKLRPNSSTRSNSSPLPSPRVDRPCFEDLFAADQMYSLVIGDCWIDMGRHDANSVTRLHR